MADRDKDIAFLNKLAKGRATLVIIYLVFAALMWILAAVASFLDLLRLTADPIGPWLIVLAFGLSLGPLWMAHTYFVISPLVREMQRLRAEIEALRAKEQGTGEIKGVRRD